MIGVLFCSIFKLVFAKLLLLLNNFFLLLFLGSARAEEGGGERHKAAKKLRGKGFTCNTFLVGSYTNVTHTQRARLIF